MNSCDHPSASQSSRETWCNNVDYRIPDIPHAAVVQQDTSRRDTVKIQQFESHPNKESFLQDLNKTEEINEFSEKSQKFIAEYGDLRALRDLFQKAMSRLCTRLGDPALFIAPVDDVKKNRRKEPRSSTRTTTTSYQFQIMLSKKNTIRGAKHGPSERERMYCKAKEMLQKARQPKHGGYRSILARWHEDDKYRNSLSLIGWTEELIVEHDKVALEDHSHVATKPEIFQNTKHWVLRLNQDGAQKPLNQRPVFAQAERECKRMHDEHVKKTQQCIDQFLVINNHDNDEDKHSKESTSTTIESILEPAGGSKFQSHRDTCRIRPRQQIGTVTIGRREFGILGILRGLTIHVFF